jgi:hypothetical protein
MKLAVAAAAHSVELTELDTMPTMPLPSPFARDATPMLDLKENGG